MTLPEPYLQVRHVRKAFGASVALEDVSLDVMPGEFVFLLGPSGCGKTTLLRIIAGLEEASGGQVIQAGRDVTRLPPARRDFGIVFQSYALFPNLSVAQNIGFGLHSQKLPRAQVEARVGELLALVGLMGYEGRYPAQLSGGQQQRIALARALAISPGLLLLDEPLSALDARVRANLRLEIASLQRRLGVTTIMVTHDQEEALTMADRIVVMDRGRIVQVDHPLGIYRNPATPFVADFVGQMNFLPGTVYSNGSGRPTVRVGDDTLHVEPWDDARHTPLAHGDRVRIAIRPEEMRLLGTDGNGPDLLVGAPNILHAHVQAVEFLGPFSRLHLQHGASDAGEAYVAEAAGRSGHRLTVHVAHDDPDAARVRAGDRVPIHLPPTSVRLFAEPTGKTP